MAEFNIPVNAQTDPAITIGASVSTDCFEQYNLTVNVSGMATRYVTIDTTGPGTSPSNIAESIVTSTSYVIILEWFIGQTGNNTTSTLRVIVREDGPSGNILEVRNFTRIHTGTFCNTQPIG